jgi:hypothetical protein
VLHPNTKKINLLLIMIVAAAILVTPSVLTSPVLTQGTADEEDGNQGTTGEAADDESPSDCMTNSNHVLRLQREEQEEREPLLPKMR